MDEIELKPCPFCGSASKLYNYLEEASAECQTCQAQILRPHREFGDGTGLEKAATAWNTRAEFCPPEGYVEAPEDPSLAMTAAGQLFGLTPNQACVVYQSMLAARPKVGTP